MPSDFERCAVPDFETVLIEFPELPNFRQFGKSKNPFFERDFQNKSNCPGFLENPEIRISRKSGSLNFPDFRNPGFSRFLILQLQHELLGELLSML